MAVGMSTGVKPSELGLGGLGDDLPGQLSEEEKKRRKAMLDQQGAAGAGALSPSVLSLMGAFGGFGGGARGR